MLVRKVVVGLFLIAAPFALIAGTAAAEDDPLLQVNLPVDQNILRVESTPDGGTAVNSPGVVPGNVAQVPVKVPVNVCGNTINVVGLLNPAAGNFCINK
jgi:hypothetical protein